MKNTLVCVSVLVVLIFCMLPAYAETPPTFEKAIITVCFQEGQTQAIIAEVGCTHTEYVFVSAYETVENASHLNHAIVRISTFHCTQCDNVIQGKEYLHYESHTMKAVGNYHLSEDNTHEFNFACYCGEADKITKACYGPPCDIVISSLQVQPTSR